ncbi:MAG TPA: ABC transporter permease [Bacilli bacterium]|nr:ABC transporter permease [Bacilli bacterium]
MNIVYDLFHLSLISAVPLLVVAIGAMISERSGVVNIALEGLMLMGAFIGIAVIKTLEDSGTSMSIQWILLIGIIVGGVVGGVFALLHAYAAISMKSNQIISATALNLFAPAFAIFTARTIQNGQQIPFTSVFKMSEIPLLSKIPFIGDLFFKDIFLSFYVGIFILIFVYFFIYKTRFGLRLRSCGENPHAADSLGINIYKMRYIAVCLSGVLAGMGGVMFVTSTSTEFNASVAGYGFLALAVLIFGNWKPFRIMFAALFFGFMRTIAAAHGMIPFLENLRIPGEFYNMIPYITTLIVLSFASRKSQAPKAAGQVYDQGRR